MSDRSTAAELPPISKGMRRAYMFFGFLLVVLVIIWVAGNMGSSGSSSDQPNTDTAIAICQLAVEDVLKAPSTAKFPLFSTARVSQTGNRFRVRSYVDAENSFGAMIRSDWDCVTTYHPATDDWSINSLDLD